MSAVLALAPAPVAASGSARPGQGGGGSAPGTPEPAARFSDVLNGQAGPVTEKQGALEQSVVVPEQEPGGEPLVEAADDAAARELADILMMLQGADAQPTLQDTESALTLLDPLANADQVMPNMPAAVSQLIQGELLSAEQMLANEADQLQQQLLTLRQAPAQGAAGAETLATGANSSVFELLQNMAAGKTPPALADVAAGGARGDVATPLYALVAGQPANAAANAASPALPLPSADAQAAFEQTLDRVVWMAREGLQQARLQLQPAHLGRIDIVLDMEGTEARLLIGSQQPQVRDALESLLPRLRESLAEQGITLADASVADSGRQATEQHPNRNPGVGTFGEHADTIGAEIPELQAVQLQKVGLLDLYV